MAGPIQTPAQRILILDDVVSSRIVLKARLTAAAHEVVQATTAEEGWTALAGGGFALAILAGSFADTAWAEAFCSELGRRTPSAPPVLVLGPATAQDSAARLRLLAAGAAGYLPAGIDAAALLAHLRALLRHDRSGPPLEGWDGGAGLDRLPATPGFAEAGREGPLVSAPAPLPPHPGLDRQRRDKSGATRCRGASGVPAPPAEGDRAIRPQDISGNPSHRPETGPSCEGSSAGWLALVAARPQAAVALRAQLGRLLPQRLALYRPDELLPALRGGPAPDAVLIVVDGGGRADRSGEAVLAAVGELHLLAELRARSGTARTPVLVLGATEPEISILALDLGAQDVLPSGFSAEELALRLRQCLARARERAQRQQALAEELRLASTDALTGLANRRAILRRLEALHAEAGAGRSYALLLLDIDHFKQVNDTWGHAAGDQVLAALAERLSASLAGDDLLGRIGGEEFLVALPRATLAEARAAADAMRRAVEAAPFKLSSGAEVWVTVSIGLCLPDAAQPPQQAIEQADRALYAAKARGRNTIWVGRPAA